MNSLDTSILRTLWAIVESQAEFLNTLSDEAACSLIIQKLKSILFLSHEEALALNHYIHNKVCLVRDVCNP